MKEGERERRGNKRGGGGVWTSLATGPTGTPIVLIISGGEDKRKKGANRNKKGRGSERRDGAPLPDSGCLDGKRVRGKRRRESTQHRGFLPQIVTKRGALYCYVFRYALR